MGVSYQVIEGQAEPLPDDVLVYNMEQGQQRTRGGIILADDTSYGNIGEHAAKAGRGIRARWAQVYKVGSNVTDVNPGNWVLVEHGRWTYAIDFIDEAGKTIKLQKVDVNGLFGVSDEYLGTEYYS